MQVGHIAYGEEGDSYYSKNAKGTAKVIQVATPMVLTTLGNIEFQKGDKPFVICDYGTADGRNSMPLIHEIIKSIKLKYGDNKPVHVVYEDQPINDFKYLFATIQGPESYLHNFREVYVTASGTSFYNQCLPPGTVNLGISFSAMHWLSTRPCNLSDGFLHQYNKNVAENELFQQQAAKDWEVILLNRAKELAHGGELILVYIGRENDGSFAGNDEHRKEDCVQIISKLWKSMVTEEEFINTTLNIYWKTESEAIAPFEDEESAVSKAGLRLVESKILVAKCPYYKEWEASKKTQADDISHGKKLALDARNWMRSTLMAGLSNQRTSQEKLMLVDAVCQKYKDIVTENPQDHCMDFVEIYLHIRKI